MKAVTLVEISGRCIPAIPAGTTFNIVSVNKEHGYASCKGLPITQIWLYEYEVVKMILIDLKDIEAIREMYEENPEYQYLCKSVNGMFVSDLRLIENPDRSMPANCSDGTCLYVDPGKRGSRCIPVNELKELTYISGDY